MLRRRVPVLARHNPAGLLHALLPGAEVPEHQPRGRDGDGPQSKVEVDGADLAEERERGEAVADGLPGRLGAAEERGVADDFLLALGEVRDDEVPARLRSANRFKS